MGKDLSKLSTQYLITAQSMVAMASREMYTYHNRIEGQQAEKKIVSDEFLKEQEEILQKKIDRNNKIIKSVDDELMRRIARDFPDATTSRYVDILHEKHNQEVARFQKLKPEEKPKSAVRTMNTKARVKK